MSNTQFTPDARIMKYSKTKPTEPGWYWCRAIVSDTPKGVGMWEAVVRIDSFGGRLICSFISNPGEASLSPDYEWREECEWSEKLTPPLDSKDTSGPAFKVDDSVHDGWIREIFISKSGTCVYEVEEAETEERYLIDEQDLLEQLKVGGDPDQLNHHFD